ncbi:hypothetical protein PMAYCL1PPCAC_13965, partial [Pristionchus mayeri]
RPMALFLRRKSRRKSHWATIHWSNLAMRSRMELLLEPKEEPLVLFRPYSLENKGDDNVIKEEAMSEHGEVRHVYFLSNYRSVFSFR